MPLHDITEADLCGVFFSPCSLYFITLKKMNKTCSKLTSLILRIYHKISLCICVTSGEKLEKGIQPAYVLGEHEALVLLANEAFLDTYKNEEGTYPIN